MKRIVSNLLIYIFTFLIMLKYSIAADCGPSGCRITVIPTSKTLIKLISSDSSNSVYLNSYLIKNWYWDYENNHYYAILEPDIDSGLTVGREYYYDITVVDYKKNIKKYAKLYFVVGKVQTVYLDSLTFTFDDESSNESSINPESTILLKPTLIQSTDSSQLDSSMSTCCRPYRPTEPEVNPIDKSNPDNSDQLNNQVILVAILVWAILIIGGIIFYKMLKFL
ncbi:MAG: hypothetical protein QXV52_08490 [Nitrososphaeria archaeon]